MIKPDPPASLADTREAVERLDAARRDASSPVDEAQVEEIVRDLVDSGVESLTVALINSYVNPAHEEQIGAIVERLYPGFPVTLIAARPARVPRVRAGADRVHELLRAAEGRRLRRPAPDRAAAIGATGGRQHPPLGRGPDDDARGGPQPDLHRSLRPVRRRRRRALRRRARPASTTSSPSTWAARRPTSRSARTGSRRSGARPRSRTSGSASRRSTSTRSARAAARSRTCPSSRRRCASARSRPAPSRARRRTARAAPSRPSPTRTSSSATCRRSCSAARWSSTSRPRAPPSQTIADAMGLDSVEEAAEGILAIVNENMAGALRLVSVQRGHDPREFALVAYGGAGPLHANAVAELIGSFPVHRPARARPALCARRPRRRLPRRVRPDVHPDPLGGGRRRRSPGSSTSSAAARTRGSRARGSPPTTRAITFTADMRYYGQGYEIPVAIDPD